MEEVKRQLYQLQNNIDNHVHNGREGNDCPVCGVNFAELADNLDELIAYEVRKSRVLDPDIEEGEIVEDNTGWKP